MINRIGTPLDDYLRPTQDNQRLLGADGNDTLEAGLFYSGSVLIGGRGNDSYTIARGLLDTLIILENGNSPADWWRDQNINVDIDQILGLDGRHLILNEAQTGKSVLFLDWERPENRIEFWDLLLEDGSRITLSFDEFRSTALSSQIYQGNFSMDTVLGQAVAAQVRAEIDSHYSAAEAADSSTPAPFLPFAVAYAAENPDLFAAFGLDSTALVNHYLVHGRREGRSVADYSLEAYAARNPDLFAAFGLDAPALVNHYIHFGRVEGRATTGFSTEAYAANNPDLYAAFGLDRTALINHYIHLGQNEARITRGFDVEAYAALNPDLFNAFGVDANALVSHYIQAGRFEGRTVSGFAAGDYAALNPDLFASFGLDATALVRHFVTFGRAEGRQAVLEPERQLAAFDGEAIGDWSDMASPVAADRDDPLIGDLTGGGLGVLGSFGGNMEGALIA